MSPSITRGSSNSADFLGLRDLTEADMEPIRKWRNSQKHVLRQHTNLTMSDQKSFYHNILVPERSRLRPNQILAAIVQSERLIGYGGLVRVDWHNRRAEISFLLQPQLEASTNTKEMVFRYFLSEVCRAAFDRLGLNRLFTETYAFRLEHIAILESFGFQSEGLLSEHVFDGRGYIDSVIHAMTRSSWKGD